MTTCLNLVLVLISFVVATTSAHGFYCYECITWPGLAGSTEACRANPGQVYQEECDDHHVKWLVDTKTGAVYNKTTYDATHEPRKKGDLLCLKLGGLNQNNAAIVIRGCGEALVDDDLDGHCVTSTKDESEGGLTIKAGAKEWICTTSNCNSGPVTGTCTPKPGLGDGNGSSPLVGGPSTWGFGFALALLALIVPF